MVVGGEIAARRKRAPGEKRGDSLAGHLLSGLGRPAPDGLDHLVGILLDGSGGSGAVLLDRRTESLGAAVVVAGELGLGAEARRVLGEELVERGLEIDLFQALVAVNCAPKLAWDVSRRGGLR